MRDLRPHPNAAVAAVNDGLSRHDRGQLVMACGTGKTLSALNVAHRRQPDRTLVLLPSLALLKQTLDEWRAEDGR